MGILNIFSYISSVICGGVAGHFLYQRHRCKNCCKVVARSKTPIYDTNMTVIREDDEDEAVAPTIDDLQLRNVQLFFRHGARTPLQILPCIEQANWDKDKFMADQTHTMIDYQVRDIRGDPIPSGPYESMYRKIVFKGGSYAGQLTYLGKEQMYNLGQELKKTYIDELKLLKPVYDRSEVYVRSTNMMRTIESARCLLAGMFGASKSSKMLWHDKIYIYTEHAEREILYPNHTFCMQLKRLSKHVFRHFDDIPGLKEDRIKVQELLGYEEGGKQRKLNFVDLRDDISARQAHGLPLPAELEEWVEKIDFYGTQIVHRMVCGTKDSSGKNKILQLACGPVLHMIRHNMDKAFTSDNFYKLQLYSCHDSMLISLLEAIGIFDNKWPPYSADLRFETYEYPPNGDFWVRVLYLGQVQRLPGCQGEFCSLDKFKQLISKLVITSESYHETCQRDAEIKPSESRVVTKELSLPSEQDSSLSAEGNVRLSGI